MAIDISAAFRTRMSQATRRFDGYITELSNAQADIQSVEDDIMATADQIMGRAPPRPSRPQMVRARQEARSTSPLGPLFERRIGTDDVVSIEFLEAGLLAKRPVGRIWDGGDSYATGFLVGQGLMMTAAHALPSIGEASDLVLQLDYEDHKFGPSMKAQEYSLDPATFFLRDTDYDVALCAVTDFADISSPLEVYGWHVVQEREENIDQGTPVSIIQHPEGRTKALVVHNSHFIDTDKHSTDERYCWYTGDTEQGSSGSPVFDLNWRIIALHSSAVPDRAPNGAILGKNGKPIIIDDQEVIDAGDLDSLDGVGFRANEGLRASRIVRCIKGRVMNDPAHETLRQKLLDLWLRPGADRIARKAIGDGLIATLTS